MSTIIQRLESHAEYCESADARQLRKDAAEHIRTLEADLRAACQKIQQMEAMNRKRPAASTARRVA